MDHDPRRPSHGFTARRAEPRVDTLTLVLLWVVVLGVMWSLLG